MIRTQVSLDPKMYEEAKMEAERQGISFAEFVRRALATMLRRGTTRSWMDFAGALELDDPGASQTVDSVVYGRERP